jgi:hypothetical protein
MVQPDARYDRPLERRSLPVQMEKSFHGIPDCGNSATFMSAVTCTYFFMAPECLNLSTSIAYPAGIIFAVICAVIYFVKGVLPNSKKIDNTPAEAAQA